MNILKIPILKRLYPSVVRRILMTMEKNEISISMNNFIFEIDITESIERKTFFLKSTFYMITQARNQDENDRKWII